jgi:predicted cobalt transporter CbtA
VGECISILSGGRISFPPTAPTGEFPSGLLWDFRVASFGTQLVFWAALGAVFGLLGERAARRRPV